MNENPSSIAADELAQIQDGLQRINFAAEAKAEEALKEALEKALKKGVMPKTALQIAMKPWKPFYTTRLQPLQPGTNLKKPPICSVC